MFLTKRMEANCLALSLSTRNNGAKFRAVLNRNIYDVCCMHHRPATLHNKTTRKWIYMVQYILIY